MKISIVTTMYRSASYLEEFTQRVVGTVTKITPEYELIFVNDGSPDESLEVALKLKAFNEKIKIVDLSRNFGHHKAIMKGLSSATGERIFLIDCDLEESPEWLESFSRKMDQLKCDVVYGVQITRKGGYFEQLSGALAYKIFNTLCSIKTPQNFLTVRLMTKRYVNALMEFSERELIFSAVCELAGFDQVPQQVTKLSNSPTTYSFSRKLSMFVNMVTSFSSAPLKMIFYTGTFIFLFALLYTGFIVFNWIFLSKPMHGWTSIMASIWLLGGLIISFLGVIGMYLSKIFTEIKHRPNSIVREIF